MARVISFSSGKGGVGKTTLVANLGTLWARGGKRVLLVDGDWNLGKLGITLGARPKYTLDDVLQNRVSLRDAVHPLRDGLSLIASPSGLVGREELDEATRNRIYWELDALGYDYDTILFDHSSGIHWGVLQFAAAAHQHLVVTTAEPTAYTDAYAIMKVLATRFRIRDFSLVVTGTEEPAEAEKVIARFSDVARSHLGIRLNLLDIIPWEPKLSEAIRRQQPFVERYPAHAITGQLERLCRQLEQAPVYPLHGIQFTTEMRP